MLIGNRRSREEPLSTQAIRDGATGRTSLYKHLDEQFYSTAIHIATSDATVYSILRRRGRNRLPAPEGSMLAT